jgi:hypothetical protein
MRELAGSQRSRRSKFFPSNDVAENSFSEVNNAKPRTQRMHHQSQLWFLVLNATFFGSEEKKAEDGRWALLP